MKTKIVIVLALLITQVSLSQKKSRGDRFFEKGDYINAIIQYEEELNREGYEKDILKNISTSYYNTFQFRKTYRYLKLLTSGRFYEKDKSYHNRFNFMMYQTLSALGEYEKAIEFLAVYEKNKTKLDINKSEVIETIERFKLKEDDYAIKEWGFNSKRSDFGAVKRDSLIYFTTDRNPNGFMDKNYKWTHRPFLDIYKIKVDRKNTSSGEATPISKEINSKLHEGNFCFSSDGNTIYISKSNSERGKKKFDSIRNNAIHLYKANKADGEWTKPEKLDFNDINYSIEHPSLNSDGTKLYFASNMPGGYGDFDIYYVAVNSDGTYGKPVNLGDKVNTANREQFPFISEEGHLFFSSNGHLGLGMMDIFVSESKEKQFTTPVNLGAPINSSFDDFSMTYYNKTDGFFASNRKKLDDNIYTFSQTGEIFIKEYIARFEIKDFATDNYISNAKAIIYSRDKEVVYENQLDSISAFEFNILPGRYDFKASANGYETKIKSIEVKEKDNETYIVYLEKKKEEIQPSDEKNDDIAVNKDNPKSRDKANNVKTSKNKEELTKAKLRAALLADKTGPPVIERNGKLYFDLPPIYFDYDKWNIRADSKKVLDEFALKLDKYKTVYIKISAHTDSRGTDSYNQVLSEKRAESTRNYLALIGYVNARRMKFEGHGESKPLIDCDNKVCSEKEHQTNRRSEFEIIKF
ncbi:OmpA family protein [Aquimarina sp. 2201CG5-10]|uniref:OmpA family protein n=1 Tax=Aquimarina callyspongiae TaxID=3098150 RepID=UPI002AB351C2|nr:OmpA family protein [Aquimarina sp. 2201CG5-10]MDY8135749.1 OmpA family protein [Aquimarina sp. 2201CG5-10]